MIFHNTKLVNLGETAVSLCYLYCWLFFSSPRDADNLSLRFENVCFSRRGLLFYCTSFWNLHCPLIYLRLCYLVNNTSRYEEFVTCGGVSLESIKAGSIN